MKSKSLTFVLAICCMSLVLMAGAVLAEDDMMMDEMMAPQVCMGLPSSIYGQQRFHGHPMPAGKRGRHRRAFAGYERYERR